MATMPLIRYLTQIQIDFGAVRAVVELLRSRGRDDDVTMLELSA